MQPWDLKIYWVNVANNALHSNIKDEYSIQKRKWNKSYSFAMSIPKCVGGYLEIRCRTRLRQVAGRQPRINSCQGTRVVVSCSCGETPLPGTAQLTGASSSPRYKRKRHHDQPGSWPHIDLGFGGASMVQARLRRTCDSWWLLGSGSWPHHHPCSCLRPALRCALRS